MPLSRSPSPIPGGGWSSPGLNINSSGQSSPATASFSGPNGGNVTWESARLKSQGVSGYPSFSTQNQGFFTRHMRRISRSLPTFQVSPDQYAEKEKAGRNKWNAPMLDRVRGIVARIGRKWKIRMMIAGLVLFCWLLFWLTRKVPPLGFVFLATDTVPGSTGVPLQESNVAWGRAKVCHHSCRQRRRWRDGVEGCPGVGDRTRQREEQAKVRLALGLRPRNH